MGATEEEIYVLAQGLEEARKRVAFLVGVLRQAAKIVSAGQVPPADKLSEAEAMGLETLERTRATQALADRLSLPLAYGDGTSGENEDEGEEPKKSINRLNGNN